jgi:hypothetical protein
MTMAFEIPMLSNVYSAINEGIGLRFVDQHLGGRASTREHFDAAADDPRFDPLGAKRVCDLVRRSDQDYARRTITQTSYMPSCGQN